MKAAPFPILDNATPWVAAQIAEYVATDGAKPTFRFDAPLLLITTLGRKSEQWRRTCLIYGTDGDRYLIVASLGGAPQHPIWYLNLKDNPRVWLQVGAEAFWAVARDASDAEMPELWHLMVGIFPDYADYKMKTDRRIPIVVLEREEQKQPDLA